MRVSCLHPAVLLSGVFAWLGERKGLKVADVCWRGSEKAGSALIKKEEKTVWQVNENFARKTPRRPRWLTSITWSSGVLPSPRQLLFVTVAMASFGGGSGSTGEHSLLLQEQTWDFKKWLRDPEFLHFCFITASEQLNWFSLCFGLGSPRCAEQDGMQVMPFVPSLCLTSPTNSGTRSYRLIGMVSL